MSGRRRFRDYDSGGNSGAPDRKRRRVDGPINVEDRLESLITRVGEKSTASLESNLEGLASVLEADLPSYKDRILQILCTCVTNLPEKTTIYTTLVGLLNDKNFDFGGEFLEMIMRNLEDVLANQQFERARLMVRFISDLLNCNFLVATSLISFLENFINMAMETNTPQVRSDWFIYTVLTALPWCAKELATKRSKELDRVLTSLQEYVSERKKLHVKALRVWSTDDPHPQEEYIDCLWAQIKKMQDDGWQEKHIRRPYTYFHATLCKALPHPIPAFKIPSHSENTPYSIPMVVFRLFDYTDCPEDLPMPGAHAIERYLAEESVSRILEAHYKDRKECANQLLSYKCKSKVPMDYIIIEVIFGHLFRLPKPPHIPAFYGSLIIELCKLQPSTIPGVVAHAVELLFQRLKTMNVTCIDKFIDWFSYHISNFQYKWTWEEWAEYGTNDTDHVTVGFIREVLEKVLRLSYHQLLTERIHESLHPLLPPLPQGNFRFEGEQSSSEYCWQSVQNLIQAIKAKKESNELLVILEEIPANGRSTTVPNQEGSTVADESFPALRTEAFTLTILRAGMKSISHTYSALTKFHKIFKQLLASEGAQIHCLHAVKEFWSRSPLMMIIVIDKLIRLQILECSSVINWIFSSEMAEDFTRYYVWEIMHKTLTKMIKHKSGVEIELHETKEKMDRLIERAKQEEDSSDSEDDSAEETKAEIEQKQYEIDELNDKLENAQAEQKQLFLILFQRFIMALTAHIVQCEQQQKSKLNAWFRFTLQRLQEIFLTYHSEIYQYVDTLESLMFTADLESHIMEVFKRFKSLRS